MKIALTADQQNVLDAITEQTLISRGPRKGSVKARISCDCYFRRCIRRLLELGLIDLKYDTIHGDGYAATGKTI